jgi:hypothetical protein
MRKGILGMYDTITVLFEFGIFVCLLGWFWLVDTTQLPLLDYPELHSNLWIRLTISTQATACTINGRIILKVVFEIFFKVLLKVNQKLERW